MAQEESLADKLMAKIQKQAIISGIKHFLNKNPKARAILPFIKDGIDNAKAEGEKYLGEAEKVIVIGRKLGKTRILIIDSTKPFSISTGLKIEFDSDKPETILLNKEIDDYLSEIYETGILDGITEEDRKNYEEMKEKGFDVLNDTKQLESGS